MGMKTERGNNSLPIIGGACSPPPSSPPPTTATMSVASPCAACKILRRRCADNCVLAPYFPPTDPIKFTTAHRVFGASNVIKLLHELPESQRADAVSSMVYEANARIRDPVYGCAGAIYQLQKQVSDLQAQLAKAQAEALKLQCHQAHLMAQISKTQSSSLSTNSSPPWSPSSGSSSPEIDAFLHFSNNNNGNIHINPTVAGAGCYLENDNSLLSLSWENLDSIIL